MSSPVRQPPSGPTIPPRAQSTLPQGNADAPVTIQTAATAPKRWEGISVILFGDSGIGKTTMARTAPAPFFVMFRGGGEHKPMPLYDTDIPWVDIYTREEWENLLARLVRDGLPDARQTLVLDQLPSLYNMQSMDILKHTKRTRVNDETFDPADFGQARQRFLRMVMDLSRIRCASGTPANLLLLSLSEPDVDPSTPTRTNLPMLPGKLAREMPGFVSFVLEMVQEKNPTGPGDQRVVYTQPRPGHFAKDASGLLPPRIAIPSPTFPLWTELTAYLKGEKTV